MVCSLMKLVVFCCCLCLFDAEPIRPYVDEHLVTLQESDDMTGESFLDYYSREAQIAKSKNAEVIIFQEYGINPPVSSAQLKEYIDYKPDLSRERINPCKDPDNHSHRPMLYSLSCLALNNNIVVMANTGYVQDCTGEGYCPRVGFLHFNTNVVFDKDGTMLMKEGVRFMAERGYTPSQPLRRDFTSATII